MDYSDCGPLDRCAAEVMADIRAKAERQINVVWPIWKQINVLRIGGDKVARMGVDIDAIRAASNVAQAAVEAAKTHADLYAVTW